MMPILESGRVNIMAKGHTCPQCNNIPGFAYKVYAYLDGALIGHGLVIRSHMGMEVPWLYDIMGEPLPHGMYELRVSEEEPRIVTVNRSIH